MRSRRLPLVAAPFIFLLLLGSFYLSRERLSWFPSSQRHPIAYKQLSKGHTVQDGTVLPARNISEYLEAIYNPRPRSGLPKFECPAINATRYRSLKAGRASPKRPAPSSPPAPPSSWPSEASSRPLFSSASTSTAAILTPSSPSSPLQSSHSGEEQSISSLPPLTTPSPLLPRSPFSSDPSADADADVVEIRYFFALDLRNCVTLLPRLIGSIIEAMQFLGPHACALSIIEGDSPDGTGDVLAALRPSLEALGVTYLFNSSAVRSAEGNRIAKLAALRNMPLEPIAQHALPLADDASVIFLNDVAACPEDILELVLQRARLGADMTCAMDWTFAGNDPTFYDVWIARGINGDSFFHIPASGSWGEAHKLLWNAPDERARLERMRPFQAFACWNGATVFSARPIAEGLRFRTNHHKVGECFQGEPVLFCKDMWWRGYGKIAVVPSVNLEYTNKNGKRIKELKGFVSDIVRDEDEAEDRIEWAGPPDKVLCMPTWKDQFFQRWNKSLTDGEM
ncbi:cryptococcal mannosyltransferase 1 domain-containing protein [Trichoderma aethiopicum]